MEFVTRATASHSSDPAAPRPRPGAAGPPGFSAASASAAVAAYRCVSAYGGVPVYGVSARKQARALPEELAVATLAVRLADPKGAAAVLAESVRWSARPGGR